MTTRTFFAFAFVVCFSNSLLHAQTSVRLRRAEEAYLHAMLPNGFEPEELLNCDLVTLLPSGLIVIVQNHAHSDLTVSGALRAAGKCVARASVLDGGTQLSARFAAGLLVAIEIDWVSPWTEPYTEHGPDAVDVTAAEPNLFPGDLIARTYGLDPAQYVQRVAFLSAMNGPLRQFQVWESDTVIGTTSNVVINSPGSVVHGNVSTAGSLVLSANATVTGGVLAAGQLQLATPSLTGWSESIEAITEPPLRFSENEARAMAQASGTYYAGNAFLTTLPPPGLVFAEGALTVTAPGAAHVGTFVSAGGPVTILASGTRYAAFHRGVFALSFAKDVGILGTGISIEGEVRSTSGTVWWLAAHSRSFGPLIGSRVRIFGMDSIVTDGTDPWPLP